MTPTERAAFARCIRSLSTQAAAEQLLEAYERQLQEDAHDAAATAELRGLEQLPAWTHGALLTWALSHYVPAAIGDSSSLLIMREFRLLGDLARACEQAMVLGEVQHAQRIAQVLASTWERVRGEQLMAIAFDREAE